MILPITPPQKATIRLNQINAVIFTHTWQMNQPSRDQKFYSFVFAVQISDCGFISVTELVVKKKKFSDWKRLFYTGLWNDATWSDAH